MAHPALFSHAAPRKVLIIGGGDCGTLREVLRHGEVASAIQIDIDEQVTRFSEKYFPIKAFAKTTFAGKWVYGLKVFTKAYSMFFPTVNAALEGSVQGVVVHAKINTSPSEAAKRGWDFAFSITLN